MLPAVERLREALRCARGERDALLFGELQHSVSPNKNGYVVERAAVWREQCEEWRESMVPSAEGLEPHSKIFTKANTSFPRCFIQAERVLPVIVIDAVAETIGREIDLMPDDSIVADKYAIDIRSAHIGVTVEFFESIVRV